MEDSRFKRIVIFGRPGSGKSTFAIWLSNFMALPLNHLDKHFYVENWKERDYKEFLQIQQKIVNKECWIIDGNSTRSFELRWSKADLVLYFNFPRVICYWRIFQRFLRPSKSLDDKASGCKENIRVSLLKYTWNFEERVAGSIRDLKNRYPHVIFKEIKNDTDLNKLKNALVKQLKCAKKT